MRKFIAVMMILVPVMLLAAGAAQADQPAQVAVIPVGGEINEAMARYLVREIEQARQSGADAILLEIDTWGGYLTSVESMSEAILDTPVPTIAYVTEKAVSAGVLVTISCDHVAMAPGSHIGAAETIPDTEKVLSAWVGMLTATAEEQGRPKDVVAAMADKRLVVPGYSAEGQLLDLTARDAVLLGVSDRMCADRTEVLEAFGYGGAAVSESSLSIADQAARILTGQAAMSIFFILGIVLMIIELFVPGFGIFGVGAILCFGLYFFSGILAGYTQWWSVILFIIGFILLVVEMLIPGFGAFGITGIVLLAGGLLFSARSVMDFMRLLAYTIGACLVLIPILVRIFGRLKFFDRIVLKAHGEGTARPEAVLPGAPGETIKGARGMTITPLRPAGKAVVAGQRLDVVSVGGFIRPNVPVRVVEAAGGRIVVEETADGE